MFELNGKYGAAKVFTDIVDENAIAQVIELLNQPYSKDMRVRMMPDIHAGAGCTIGTTMTVEDKICPNLVGVDIGCGVLVAELNTTELDLAKLDKVIHEHVPSGRDIHDSYSTVDYLAKLHCWRAVNLDRAYKSVGTLGGGNHFIEIDKDMETGQLYLVIHSGSRHLGTEVCKYYQELAYKNLTQYSKQERDSIIADLKAQGRQREISDVLKSLKRETSIPKALAYVEGSAFDDYIRDIKITQQFANRNRMAIMNTILEHMGLDIEDMFTSVHNYIDTDHMILRKGAISAEKGEKLIIPINMRDGSLICVGKGNIDWNCSAPHGAGRLMSRAAAKENLSLAEFKATMNGIYSTTVDQGTIDEAPMAYKPIDSIVQNIEPTVDIVKQVKPIYNFKASED